MKILINYDSVKEWGYVYNLRGMQLCCDLM